MRGVMVPFLNLTIFLGNMNNIYHTEYKPGMFIIQKCEFGVGRLVMYWNEVSSVHKGYIYLRKKLFYI